MFPSLVVIKPNHAISSFQFGVVYILRVARPNERALLRFTASDRAQTTTLPRRGFHYTPINPSSALIYIWIQQQKRQQ